MIRGFLLGLLTLWLGTVVVAKPVVAKPPVERWRLSFELAFGADSPYSRKYPNLYELPYATNEAITQDVLNQIIPIALRESGAKQVRLLYGPGGYRDYPVTPSAQLEIEATPGQMHNAADIIGYLAEQTEVMASRAEIQGPRAALDILETRGQRLREPAVVERFWSQLRVRAPQLQGFSPLARGGQSGVRVMDADGAWSRPEMARFGDAVSRTGLESGLELQSRQLQVRLVRTGNDWKTRPAGESYLYRIKTGASAGLAERLRTRYRPQVEGWIQRTFHKYAQRSAAGNRRRLALKTPTSSNQIQSPGFSPAH